MERKKYTDTFGQAGTLSGGAARIDTSMNTAVGASASELAQMIENASYLYQEIDSLCARIRMLRQSLTGPEPTNTADKKEFVVGGGLHRLGHTVDASRQTVADASDEIERLRKIIEL